MEPTPPAPEPTPDPERQAQTPASDPDMPVLARPVRSSELPNAIATVRALTIAQVVLVMVCGNCSFGITLASAIGWLAEWGDWHEDSSGFAITGAWAIGFAAIATHAHFTNRWAIRADRRARTTILIGLAVLVGLTAVVAVPAAWWEPQFAMIILIAAAPPLIVQAILLRCVYGPEGRRWFESSGADRMDGSA